MAGALDAPATAAAFHAVADQGENVALHTAQAGVVDHAGNARLGDRKAPLIRAGHCVLVLCIVRQQFPQSLLLRFVLRAVHLRLYAGQQVLDLAVI